mgnify:CR=1 FL=1
MFYEVINPIIIGTLKVKYDANNASEAAQKFWKKISKIIMSDIPQTYFTLRDENGKLYHFKISEKKSSENMADYMLSSVEQVDDESMKKMVALYGKVNREINNPQSGGRHHRYDDDDSSSIESVIDQYNRFDLLRKKFPVAYYHYIPDVYKSKYVFIPSFIYPYMPAYVEMGFSSAFWDFD